MKKCPACNHENPDDSVFCENCGHKFTIEDQNKPKSTSEKACPNCGHQNKDDAVFCEQCGHKLIQSKPQTSEQQPENKTEPRLKLGQCPNCGHKNPVESDFCENCGHKLVHKKTTDNSAAPIEKHQEVNPISKPAPNQPIHAPETDVKTSQKKNNWIPIAIIVLLLVAGGGAYFFMNHNQSNASDQTTQVKKTKAESKPTASTSTKKESDNNSDSSTVPTSEIKNIINQDMDPLNGNNGVYYYNLNDHTTASSNATSKIRAASDIKLFIMAAAFQKISDGSLSLSDRYTLTDDDKVGGTGVVQSMSTGTSLTYKDLINYMITQSDNTAANIITDKVGGISDVNDEINKLGLYDTDMQRKLMDQEALDAGKDNYSCAKDLGTFLTKLYQNKVVSKKYDQQMLDFLANDSNHSKLPSRINTDVVKVYNKTGEYNKYGVQNDAAIFKRDKQAFVIVVMSENGTESDQKAAMGDLGADLAKKVFGN